MLRYLAVAHYGRGRGEWAESEYPPFWSALANAIVDERRDRLAELWSMREPACDAAAIAAALHAILHDAASEMLDRLYPGALARHPGDAGSHVAPTAAHTGGKS